MIIKRLISLVLALSLTLALAGCSGRRGTYLPALPEWVSERAENIQSWEANENIPVNFYYDNTLSMIPFAITENGKGEPILKSNPNNMLHACVNAIDQILSQYHGNVYTLQKSEEIRDTQNRPTYVWQLFTSYPDTSTQIKDVYNQSTFYLPTTRSYLPDSKSNPNIDVGPLSQLYGLESAEDVVPSVMDNRAINIVLTDMAEQNVNNYALAAKINQHILSQDGYSAYIIAFKAYFDGTAYIPRWDMQGRMEVEPYEGERQLYLILTGPEDQLDDVFEDLDKAINPQRTNPSSVDEGKYKTASYSVREEDRLSRAKSVAVGTAFPKDRLNTIKNFIKETDFKGTLGVESLDSQALKDKFDPESSEVTAQLGDDGYFTSQFFAYHYQPNGEKKVALNYYIPLEKYDEGKDFVVRLGISQNKDENDAESKTDALKGILSGKDYLCYSYSSTEQITIEPDASSDKRTRPQTSTVTVWRDGVLSELEKSFQINCEVVSFDDDEDHIIRNPELIDNNGISAQRKVTFNNEFELKGDCDHWLRINVVGTGNYSASDVVFDIPVYAWNRSSGVDEIPDWIYDWNTEVGDEKDAFYSRTYNLIGFYTTLFGIDANIPESVRQASREVKIADITTLITGLPVSSSR